MMEMQLGEIFFHDVLPVDYRRLANIEILLTG